MTAQASLGSTGIYVWTDLISDPSTTVTNLINSGFQVIIPWSLHIRDNGDLVLNDTNLVQNGNYVGPDSLATSLSNLKNAGKTIILSVGAAVWGNLNYDFTNLLKFLGEKNGNPIPGDNLMFKNFSALREALPYIDGFDFDNEDCTGAQGTKSMYCFGALLHQLGYKIVTFCPYTGIDMWANAYNKLEAVSSGLVQRWNLQCYAGGAPNTPQDWIEQLVNTYGFNLSLAQSLISPGLADNVDATDCGSYLSPSQITETFSQAGWLNSKISSAWIWRYDDILWAQSNCNGGNGASVNEYQQALVSGLASSG